MTITISIDSISARIFAQTALSYTIGDLPHNILTPDSSDALKVLAETAAANISLTLIPILDPPGFSNIDADIISFHINDDCTVNPIELRLLIEHTMVSMLLSQVYSEADPIATDTYRIETERALSRLRSLIASVSPLDLSPFPW